MAGPSLPSVARHSTSRASHGRTFGLSQDTSTRKTEPEKTEAKPAEKPSPLSRLRALPRPHPRRAWRRWKAAHPKPAQVIGIVVTALALALVAAALVMPNRWETYRTAEFVRL